MSGTLNWRLILQLSLFGLAMGVATVFVLPPWAEPFCWLAIFVVCAVILARGVPARHFLHGLCTSLANSVWITGAHLAFYDTYLANHPAEASMVVGMPLPGPAMMLLTGPLVGAVSGVVLGLFAVAAARLLRRAP